ncbi:M23 family metallopeptidase [Leucobacter luti]|uniref:M23 family metallopeptidase n=1 Tax=Leucobacter luti TaxID=340320 RepID=UPI001C693DBD|nr:M23 family metallopeptidase [Leucobacter luti]QYM75900.1 M23 family metallopeptidase [Leucobacter luti]
MTPLLGSASGARAAARSVSRAAARAITRSGTTAVPATALLLAVAAAGAVTVTLGIVHAAGPAAGAVGPDRWLSPLAGQLVVSGPYLAPPTPYSSGHRGIDLPAAPGAAVRAPEGGTVSFVGSVVDRDTITIRVNATTVYSIEPLTSPLSVGSTVPRGGSVGTIASGGHCESECVHLGVRVNEEYVSPLRFLLGAPVLLPW